MLSDNIRRLRIANNLNQVQLANKLGVSKQCVSNWENNNIQPSVDMLVKISDFFGITTDYILDRTSDRLIDVTGLNDSQISHLKNIIDDLRR